MTIILFFYGVSFSTELEIFVVGLYPGAPMVCETSVMEADERTQCKCDESQ